MRIRIFIASLNSASFELVLIFVPYARTFYLLHLYIVIDHIVAFADYQRCYFFGSGDPLNRRGGSADVPDCLPRVIIIVAGSELLSTGDGATCTS